jgi:large subunit ribosomal protein L30
MAEEKKLVAKKTSPINKIAAKKIITPAKETTSKKIPGKEASIKRPTVKKITSKKNTVNVTLVKSFYGRLPSHRATITGLGLKRINHTVKLLDTPEVRGMINKVFYLLKVED